MFTVISKLFNGNNAFFSVIVILERKRAFEILENEKSKRAKYLLNI